ncbi:MAG: adenosylcobinamide-phosphate synthase [Pseudonocardiales bacterium]|nr:adenosylcobinamide-phosphate synthase [Pseudonocardiales bacterium]
MSTASRARAAGLLLGAAADALLGDPRRWHPVAGFGTVAAALERRTYADRRAAGAGHVAVLVGGAVALGAMAERAVPHPVGRTLLTAAATWVVLGGASLAREGAALARELDRGDLAAARARLPGLCGRDPAVLDAGGLARAATESVAENTSDAVVAPLLWGAVAGVPGLLGYRAVNTLDAMVGYRSPRYLRFGWAAARLDDAANLAPARVAALLVAACAPAVGGSPRAAVRAWRRDAAAHPSPNAGPVEAAAAGALGVTLGGRTAYRHRVEERPRLGAGPPPGPADLRRAARLSRLVGAAAAVLAAVLAEASTVRGPCRRPQGVHICCRGNRVRHPGGRVRRMAS